MSSKIKVDTIENVAGSGNVSLGSGHNLVVPGNNTTSGNATVGGTFGVTGATTTAGITSSAAHTVTTSTHANASVFKSTGNTQIMLQDTDASANDQFWGLQNSGGEFNILTCNDDRASGFVTPMTITQAGQVLKPNQPMFALKNTGNSTHYKQASVQIDQGSHWDNVNGRFTAPIAGKYFFFAGIQSNSDGAFYWGLYKNGTLQTSFYNDPNGGTYLHASVAQIISLAASDYVEFKMAGSQAANTGGQNHFSGFLIG